MMENFPCYASQCTSQALYRGSINQDTYYWCKKHREEYKHQMQTTERIVKTIHKETKNSLILLYSSTISEFQQTQSKILKFSNEEIQKIKKLTIKHTKELQNWIKFFQTHIKVLTKQKKFSILTTNPIEKHIINMYESSDNSGFIKESEKIFQNFNKVLREKFVPSIFEVKKNYVETPKIPFLDYSSSYFSSNQSIDDFQNLYFNKHNSQEIVIIELDKKFETLPMKVNFSVDKNWGAHACICKISDKELFIHGGYCFSFCDTYKLNLETLDIEVLPSWTPRYTAACVYKDSKVFVFGGIDENSVLNTAAVYDLQKNTWKELSCMPKPSQTNTAVTYKNQIMIVGLELDRIVLYSDDIYYTLDSPKLPSNKQKIILQAGSKYFVIEVTKIWETQDFKTWDCYEKTSENIPEDLALLTYPVNRGNYVYFIFNDHLLRRFDILSYRVEVIKKIIA